MADHDELPVDGPGMSLSQRERFGPSSVAEEEYQHGPVPKFGDIQQNRSALANYFLIPVHAREMTMTENPQFHFVCIPTKGSHVKSFPSVQVNSTHYSGTRLHIQGPQLCSSLHCPAFDYEATATARLWNASYSWPL